MITFIPTIKDTKTQRLTMEKWEELTTSAQTKHYISDFRKKGNLDMKQRLPAVNFHGYDPKVLQGLPGSRKQADLVPTGLFMLDVDHIDNPKAVWEKFKKQIQVPCTGCRYCMPCPKGVDIPGTFYYYNLTTIESKTSARFAFAQNMGMRKDPCFASQCVKCGKCKQHCPQHIDIPEKLAEADKALRPLPYKIAINIIRKYFTKDRSGKKAK